MNREKGIKKSSRKSQRNDLTGSIVTLALVIIAALAISEIAEYLLYPQISIWLAGTIKFLLVFLLAAWVSCFVLRRKERLLPPVNKEVTERKQMEIELEEALIMTVAADRAKSEFISNMSHELRSPLNSMLGFSDMLQEELYGPLNEKQKEYVGFISSSSHKLLDLINEIIEFSRVKSAEKKLQLSKFSLRSFFDSLAEMTREMMVKEKKLNINLTFNIEANIDLEIEADKILLKRIAFSLLTNAIKFTPNGGAVSVTARRVKALELENRGINTQAGDFLQISVADTGIGVKTEDLSQLFKTLIQLETLLTKTHSGIGLGLALTKRLVELYGGKIWVESEFGQGSKFTFAIPLKQYFFIYTRGNNITTKC